MNAVILAIEIIAALLRAYPQMRADFAALEATLDTARTEGRDLTDDELAAFTVTARTATSRLLATDPHGVL